MKSYFPKRTFFISSTLIALITAAFVFQSLNQPPNPKGIILNGIMKAPSQDAFKVLNVEYEAAKNLLSKKGIIIQSGSDSLDSIGKQNNISPFKIISIVKESL